MAKAVIQDVRSGIVKKVYTRSPGKAKISDNPNRVKIEGTIPFRVKFINIGIPAYGPGAPPPIGIAIIGVNNYIL